MTARSTDQMRNIPPFGLRMQPDLKARVQEAADANGRSMNSEIIARLESTFPRIMEGEENLPERFGIDDETQKVIDARAMEMFQAALDLAVGRMRERGVIDEHLDRALSEVAKPSPSSED